MEKWKKQVFCRSTDLCSASTDHTMNGPTVELSDPLMHKVLTEKLDTDDEVPLHTHSTLLNCDGATIFRVGGANITAK